MATRGAKRKILRFNANANVDSKEQVDNMPTEKEEVPVEKTVPNSGEKVNSLGVSDSPMMEAMIERKGGDDFLYKDQKDQTNQQQQEPVQQQENTQPVNNTQQQTNQQPATQTGGPKEFQFDPVSNIPPANTTGGTGTGSEAPINEIPSEISDESSKMIADMLLEGFGMIAPEVVDRYSKINEGQIRKLERDNKIQPGFIEIAKQANKNNKNAVKVTNEQKNLIRKPLIKVLEVQGVKASPESMLIIAMLAVCVMLYIQARGIKRENDDMVKSWMEDHSTSKKLKTENDKLKEELNEYREKKNESLTVSDAVYAEVEVV